MFLITGQSLAVGVNGIPVVSTTQPYSNLRFSGGVRTTNASTDTAVPLVETTEPDPFNPAETDGETVASGVANELSALTQRNFFASCSGLSGAVYNAIKKGTATYDNAIDQVTAAGAAILAATTKDFLGVGGVLALHGEADQAFEAPGYAAKLAQWQSDYELDIQAITGQATSIPLFIYQQCNASPAAAPSTSVATALESLAAARANPEKIILVTPNFLWLRSDGVHLYPHGYRAMGCMFSRVIKHVVIDGGQWLPFAPSSITLSGATIDCVFDVPEPPLVFDLESVLNPGNYGFEYKDDNDNRTISSVSILNPTTVRIVLSGVPDGANRRLRYGFTPTSTGSGPFISGRGNLCDSGNNSNIYGYQVVKKNWACLFDDPIPYPGE